MKKTMLILIALAAFSVSIKAHAAEPDEGVLCVQIYPCDEEGNLLSQFLDPQGECFDYYASQCKNRVDLIKKEEFCRETSTEVEKLRQQIKRLKKERRTRRSKQFRTR
jgi:hypothetical protein